MPMMPPYAMPPMQQMPPRMPFTNTNTRRPANNNNNNNVPQGPQGPRQPNRTNPPAQVLLLTRDLHSGYFSCRFHFLLGFPPFFLYIS